MRRPAFTLCTSPLRGSNILYAGLPRPPTKLVLAAAPSTAPTIHLLGNAFGFDKLTQHLVAAFHKAFELVR